MSKLHKESNNDIFMPKEGQRDFLCNNKSSFRCPSLSSSLTLSKDALGALEELVDVLRVIHRRMTNEGYEIVNGHIQKVKL